jgi:argininosuccinate lyase (EC 4.3.2.1)
MRTDVVRLGRLSGERTGDMMKFLSSMRSDRYIADSDVLVDIAHVLMLERQKIISTEIAKQLLPALLELNSEGIPEEAFDDRFEDVHAGIESLLIEAVGADVGGRMHMGRSRNDEVATCIRLKLREDLLKQMAALLKVREVLIAIAEQHRESVMPGFTHMQHAQPTTLAHHLLAYEQQFSRDFDRLRDAYARVNLCPLGAAAFASTGYPIDREYTAKILAFGGLVANTMDAVATRDFALETLADLSILMANVSRLCEELVIWSTSFVKFVTLDDAFCSTSSIMPQKKNPDTAEIMRAKTGSVFGAYTGALMTIKGLPMSYNRDLQELTPQYLARDAGCKGKPAAPHRHAFERNVRDRTDEGGGRKGELNRNRACRHACPGLRPALPHCPQHRGPCCLEGVSHAGDPRSLGKGARPRDLAFRQGAHAGPDRQGP